MSTVKVNEVKHLSNTGTANIVLESNATTNLQATSTLGLTVTGTLTVSGVSTLNGNTIVGNASSDTMSLISTVSGFNNFSGFTGEIRMYAGNAAGDSPPAGWLYCNGDTISSTIDDGGTNLGGTHYNADGKGNDYQPLFNLLKASSDWGNSSSASWGTDKVKVPDFRSRSPVGIATGAANAADARSTGVALPTGLTGRTLGDGTSIADGSTLVGKETHALVIAELALHTHVMTNPSSLTGTTISNPTHTHTYTHTHGTPGSTTGTESAAHDHNIRQGYNAGAEDAQGIGSSWGGEGVFWSSQHLNNNNSSHTHTVPTGTTTSQSASTTSATAPGQALTDPQHTHISTAANTGSGTAHTILSPIIAVNYIIKV